MRRPSLAGILALGGFGLAGWWSLRAGWADYCARQETVAGTERALAAMPGQAEYQARLAALLADSDPRRAEAALHRAVALNPLDAHSWIDLGLRAEARADLREAEACLLRAASADRKYLPRWTLANFYFRHDRTERFWFWARAASEMVYADPTPLFRLCGRVEEDGRLLERLQARNQDLRASYLAYLLGERRLDLIGPVTSQLLEDRRTADVSLLLGACERLIEGRRVGQAVALWNGLARAGRVQFATLDPAAGAVLTNGNFATAPSSRAFDWRLPNITGVDAAREENPAGVRLTFSGQQAERVEVLTQYIPVLEGAAYRLRAAYRTSAIPSNSGLRWIVTGLDGAILATGESLSSETDATTTLPFQAPRSTAARGTSPKDRSVESTDTQAGCRPPDATGGSRADEGVRPTREYTDSMHRHHACGFVGSDVPKGHSGLLTCAAPQIPCVAEPHQMLRLSLIYQRAPGTTRIEGFVILRNLALEQTQFPSGAPPRSRAMK